MRSHGWQAIFSGHSVHEQAAAVGPHAKQSWQDGPFCTVAAVAQGAAAETAVARGGWPRYDGCRPKRGARCSHAGGLCLSRVGGESWLDDPGTNLGALRSKVVLPTAMKKGLSHEHRYD